MMIVGLFLLYFSFSILGMICARISFSSTVSWENKKQRIKGIVIRAAIISVVLTLPLSDLENLGNTHTKLMSTSIVIGFMIQWERSKAKLHEYIKMEREPPPYE